jgi:hypothetical protein
MRFALALAVLLTCVVLLLQPTAAVTSQCSTCSDGVANRISKGTAKEHTLRFPSSDDETKTSCPIYQHRFQQVKYEYYSILFKIKYFFIRLIDYFKDFYSSTRIDEPLSLNRRFVHNRLKFSKGAKIRETISEIIQKLPVEERNAAGDIHRKWITDCHMFGQNIVYAMKKQAESLDKLLDSWIARYRYHINRFQDDEDMKSDQTQLCLLLINQDWILTKYRMDRLYKQQYKYISGLRFDSKDRPTAFAPLYEIFDQYQSSTLYITQHFVLKNMNQTKSDLEWQLYQSYVALKGNRAVTIVRENGMFEEPKQGLIVLSNKNYQSLIPKIQFYWDSLPENSLPFSFFSTASYWQIVLYFVKSMWGWIVDLLKECLQKSNQAQKKKFHDAIVFFR